MKNIASDGVQAIEDEVQALNDPEISQWLQYIMHGTTSEKKYDNYERNLKK